MIEPTDKGAIRLDWPAEGIARVTLCRGSAMNTLTMELLEEFGPALSELRAAKTRVLIVTGEGRAFCGGAHIKYFTDETSPFFRNPVAIRDDYVAPIIRVFAQLRDAPFPTIAAINGFAFGGGCELALNCDFRLMGCEAKIGLTETRLGALAGAGGVQLLSRIVGRTKALEIALLGDQLTAPQALETGLVHAVHEADQLADAAVAFARRFLLCSPISVAETKRALYRCETATAEEADRIALDAVAVAASGPEWWEGMSAFTQKRKPDFRLE
jgi:enoyl-CoA hydratase/carnithine racemase